MAVCNDEKIYAFKPYLLPEAYVNKRDGGSPGFEEWGRLCISGPTSLEMCLYWGVLALAYEFPYSGKA